MKEALKLALEALEEPLAPTKRLKAITAIKEALREHAMYEVQRLGQEIQPEQSETSDFQPDWMNYQQGYMDGMSQAIADMALEKDKPQPKEPEQEAAPVAKNEGGRITWMIDDWPQNCLLYTHTPPQRTWVGLDNDDLVWIYSNSDKVGQAISNTEAKLRSKNT